MPSPTSTTVPTLRVSVFSSKPSIADLMMLMISSERMAIGSPFAGRRGWRSADCESGALAAESPVRAATCTQLIAQAFEATPHAGIDEPIADPDGQAADECRVDLDLELDRRAGHGPQPF